MITVIINEKFGYFNNEAIQIDLEVVNYHRVNLSLEFNVNKARKQ